MIAEPDMEDPSVPRLLAGLAIDYLRWTQLVPMLTVWTFLIVMVGAVLLISFQQQSLSLIDWSMTTYERYFGPIELETTEMTASPVPNASTETDAAPVKFSDDDFMPWAFTAWGVVALAGWLLSALLAKLFGPRAPMPLERKLVIAAVPALASSALLILAYFFGGARFNGSAIGWMVMFLGMPFGVWLVSVYSLSVAHVLDLLRRRVVESA